MSVDHVEPLDGVPGWPRPLVTCVADLDSYARPAADGRLDDATVLRPMSWESQLDTNTNTWNPWIFDSRRADAMIRHDLCQVCGGPRGVTVYALASERVERSHLKQAAEMTGGALCTPRCARLSATACPHFRAHWPVGIYNVSKAATRQALTNSDFPVDESYDLRGLQPDAIIGNARDH